MTKGEGGLFQKGTGTMSLNASDHIQNHAYVIVEPTVKDETVNLLKENIEYLYDLG